MECAIEDAIETWNSIFEKASIFKEIMYNRPMEKNNITQYFRCYINEFDKSTISFTYGDSHPTFSPKVNDGKEYRKKLYTYDEISGMIAKYGYPQDWNNDGTYGPERYIEAHIWSDDVIKEYV